MKGQFMLISAVVAALITITLSATISDIQSQRYNTKDLPENINQIRDEAERITADGDITDKEARNFRKMTGYIENYRVKTEFDRSKPCVQVALKSTEREIQLPCMD